MAAAAALAVAGAALGLAAWRSAGPGPAMPATPFVENRAREPGVVTEQVHLVGRHRGERQWELDAVRIELPEADARIRFGRVSRGVFYRGPEPLLWFEGDGGSYDAPAARLYLRGAFRLRDARGDRLEASELLWDGPRAQLSTNRPVRLQGEGLDLRADAMTLDVERAVAHFTGDVVVRQASGGTVRASRVDWYVDTGEIQLFGPSSAEGPGEGR